MKLRTKFQDEDFELGEVVDANMFYSGDARQGFKVVAIAKAGGQCSFYYNSIKDFTDHWEDAPEPEGYWYIRDDGSGVGFSPIDNSTVAHRRLVIGNHFESEVEAKAVEEKLKAWTRLEDKGFKVDLWDYDGGNYQERTRTGRILFRVKDYEKNDEDLDICFGGEE